MGIYEIDRREYLSQYINMLHLQWDYHMISHFYSVQSPTNRNQWPNNSKLEKNVHITCVLLITMPTYFRVWCNFPCYNMNQSSIFFKTVSWFLSINSIDSMIHKICWITTGSHHAYQEIFERIQLSVCTVIRIKETVWKQPIYCPMTFKNLIVAKHKCSHAFLIISFWLTMKNPNNIHVISISTMRRQTA